jgi:hypothetical protein
MPKCSLHCRSFAMEAFATRGAFSAFAMPTGNVHATGVGIRSTGGRYFPEDNVLKLFVFDKVATGLPASKTGRVFRLILNSCRYRSFVRKSILPRLLPTPQRDLPQRKFPLSEGASKSCRRHFYCSAKCSFRRNAGLLSPTSSRCYRRVVRFEQQSCSRRRGSLANQRRVDVLYISPRVCRAPDFHS